MVFAINAPEEGERTLATFKEKAKAARHPDPADRETADFTPPAAPGSPPPAGSDAPPSSPSDTAAPTESNVAPVEFESSAAATDPALPSDVSAQLTNSAPSVVPTADQANIAPADSSPSTTPSGALSAVRVPGAGIALTLAGLLAGMLL